MNCGCRITHHLKDWDLGFSFSSFYSSPTYNKTHHFQPPFYKLIPPFKTSISPSFSSFLTSFSTLPSLPFITTSLYSKHPPILNHSSFRYCLDNLSYRARQRAKLGGFDAESFSTRCKSKCLLVGQKNNERELSSEGLSSVAGGIVALGKFDALHIGHRELAIQASKAGAPFLLSFVGMAEVLGWAPRLPIVAKCDRQRVLSSWAPYCGNVSPKEFLIDFASVRHLTPQQFVEKLSQELGVLGVVAGENYRFGYKAAGDASELVRLCDKCGIQAYIINSVMDKNQDMVNSALEDKKEKGQVSSTRVRYALSKGEMTYVSELLGRSHRLILSAEKKEEFVAFENRLSTLRSYLLNLSPKEGLYKNCSLIFGDESQLPCRVVIDSTQIHIESDERDFYTHDAYKNSQILGIEFRC